MLKEKVKIGLNSKFYIQEENIYLIIL